MGQKDKKTEMLIRLRRAETFLAPYFRTIDIDFSSNDPMLSGKLFYNGNELKLRIPLDKRLIRLMRLLWKLEPAIYGERVKVEDVVLLIYALYAPLKNLYPFRSKIRKVTGLAKSEEKLMNYIIWKRIITKKGKNGREKFINTY